MCQGARAIWNPVPNEVASWRIIFKWSSGRTDVMCYTVRSTSWSINCEERMYWINDLLDRNKLNCNDAIPNTPAHWNIILRRELTQSHKTKPRAQATFFCRNTYIFPQPDIAWLWCLVEISYLTKYFPLRELQGYHLIFLVRKGYHLIQLRT